MPSHLRLLFLISLLSLSGNPLFGQEVTEQTTGDQVTGDQVEGNEKSADALSVEAISHPENLELSLWAGSEQVSNPVAFTFGNNGRMYMCETFRQNKGVTDNRSHMEWLDDDLAAQTLEDRLAYFKKHLKDDVSTYGEEEDRITILEDKDGDGKADAEWVFADGFRDILTGTGAGVLVHDGEVYYTCIPDLWKITDKDNDGNAESQVSLHYGYGVRVAFRGHDSHGLVIGPDGRLYFSIGDRGYNIQTNDGHHLKDPESGAVFRCELDGSGLEVFATGLRNPQELCFDDAGNLFTGDNNSDSGDRARWVHVIEGGETGWRMAYQYLPDRGPWNREKLWHPRHEGQAAYIIPPIRNFADGPSGLAYYPGTGLGDEYMGTFFLCDFRGDAAISGIRSFKMLPSGASFEMSEPRQFMWNVLATDVDFGPDGSLYTSDWIQGWEGVNRGRIVRVTSPQHSDSPEVEFVASFLQKDISQTKPFQLTKLLRHKDRRVRMKAQLELAKRESVQALINRIKQPGHEKSTYFHAIHALGHIARKTNKPQRRKRIIKSLPEYLANPHASVRAAIVNVMGDLQEPDFLPAMIAALKDDDAFVQTQAGIALGKLKYSNAVEPLLEMIERNDDQDVVVRHAGVMGLKGCSSESELASFATHEKRSVRLAAVLTLRRLQSSKLAAFLKDEDPFISLEAARAIHDVPIVEAMPSLAQVIKQPIDQNTDEALLRRVLNANYRIGSSECAELVAATLATPMSDAMKLEAIDMLDNWANPSDRDRVLGMWRPLESRQGEAAKAAMRDQFAQGVLASTSPAVTVAAIEVASNMGLSEVAPTIRKLIKNDKADPEQRADLLSSLGQLKDAEFDKLVTSSLSDPSPIVRSRARNLLYDLDNSRGLKELSAAVQADTAIERQSALAKLADANTDASKAIIQQQVEELAQGIPTDTQLDVVEAAKAVGLESSLASFENSLSSKPYGMWHLTEDGGDAKQGEEIFQTNVALSCLRCHRVGRDGGRVGPNLAGIGKEKKADYILESIVDPNKKIADGFGTLIVVTEDGVQHQGVVQKESANLIHMIDADAKRFFVSKDEIIAKKVGKSAMPEDLAKKLTPFQLRDLIAYLKSLKTPYEGDDSRHEE